MSMDMSGAMDTFKKVVEYSNANQQGAQADEPLAPAFGLIRSVASLAALALAVLTQVLPRVMVSAVFLALSLLAAFLCYCRFVDEGFWRQIRVSSWVARPILEHNVLLWWMHALPYKHRGPYVLAFHEAWRDYPLAICTALGGFYVKMGQQASFAVDELVPAPYRKSLAVLQEDVPAQPFKITRRTVERELGCKMEEVFLNFQATPVAAASIGQVHFAELLDGTPVVVKVQYPDVRRYFRVDMRTLLRIMWLTSNNFKQMLQEQENNFAREFDYVKEARGLRLMFDKLNGFSDIHIPEPYDARHGKCPAKYAARGGLVTGMMLVMDRVPGKSVTKIAAGFLEEYARSQGMSAKEFKDDLMDKLSIENSAALLNEMAEKGQGAVARLVTTQVLLSTRTLAWNAFAATYNWTFGMMSENLDYQWTGLALNGPDLIRRLYDIHAEQLFALGLFNADPHVGNLLIDEKTGTLHLLDFGQLYEIKKTQRVLFAKSLIAMLDGDRASTHKYWKKLGNDFWWTGPNPVEEVDLYYAMVHSIYNGDAGFEVMLKVSGCPDIITYMERLPMNMYVARVSAACAMVHRMTDCLRGAAMTLGAGNPSAAELYRPAAERFLANCKGFMAA